jgi:mannose-6-phosphate isomerase-like protein (cupin superfamily)
MIARISEASAKRLGRGVEQKVLLSPPQTSWRLLTVSLITLDPGAEVDFPGAGTEWIYFVLDGRGIAAVKWLKGSWRYLLRGDMAIRIPGLDHGFKNSGDAALRLLSAGCRDERSVDERFVFVDCADARKADPVHLATSQEVMIFPAEGLHGSGSHFNLYACDTIWSGGATDLHIPTDECEESMYVTRGRGVMTIGGQSGQVEAGCLGYVRRNTLHREQNTGDEPLEYVVFETHRTARSTKGRGRDTPQ